MSGLFSLESWSTVWMHRESFLLGLGNTLQTAVCALALAFIIGAALGLMSTSGSKLLRIIARIYVEFVQNTPLLLQLCFLYYALAFAGVSLGVIRTGIIALGVYTGAYMGEVVRAAIESVPKGQFEAAQAQGFNYLQRMGYIILPQSIPVMLPPMVNQVVNLFKNTSCLYIVGGADLISVTYSFVTGASTGGAYAPAYIVCGLIFFVVCFPLSTLAARWASSLVSTPMPGPISSTPQLLSTPLASTILGGRPGLMMKFCPKPLESAKSYFSHRVRITERSVSSGIVVFLSVSC